MGSIDDGGGDAVIVCRSTDENASLAGGGGVDAEAFEEEEHLPAGGDGSDSGVEFCGGQQRSNGKECSGSVLNLNEKNVQDKINGNEGQFSCDSSMLSFCSDENLLNDQKMVGTSECGGSESSSVCNHPMNKAKSSPANKKRVNLNGNSSAEKGGVPNKTSSDKKIENSSINRVKLRASSMTRVGPSILNDRARSREKLPPSSTLTRTNSIRRPVKPDSLPISSPMATQRRTSTLTRTQSVRTPSSTPNDDGRWPYVKNEAGTPRSSAKQIPSEPLFIKTRIGHISLNNNANNSNQSTFDKYATMPRRRREKSADPRASMSNGGESVGSNRSSSITREQLSKLTSSTSSLKTIPSTNTTPVKVPSTPGKDTNQTPKPRVPPRRLTQKVKIYQESASQTAITSQDVENAFAGNPKTVNIDEMERTSVGTQSDIRDKELELLREKVKILTEEQLKLQDAVSEKTVFLANVEQQLNRERESKLQIQKELQCNTERVLAILESYSGSNADLMESTDSLMILESKITSDNHLVTEQRDEIRKLRKICVTLQRELQETLDRERKLIAEHRAIEQESQEMQEFLQNEKSALIEALKVESDKEKVRWEEMVDKKEREIERLREECRYLVRFSEQRRQENMGMQAKYGALEMRSKELMVQQTNAVSGASVALSNLGVRLESLVDQLIASYNISEHELEDVVFHNEAYPDSGGSSGNGDCNNSPHEEETGASNIPKMNDLSPQRSHSFINVVINAIRNATSMAKNRQQNDSMARVPEEAFNKSVEDSEDSTDLLDSETEPCLMMENVLEDVTIPDTHSQNLVSTSTITRDLANLNLNDTEDNSLNNLSQAISNRQQIELQTSQMNRKTILIHKQQSSTDHDEDLSHASSIADIPSICDYCTNTQSIVEQVISVDNLITKLLKVLRIIQLDNDSCIQHLVGEKNKLQLNKDDIEEKLKDWEDVNANLKSQLTEVTQQLLDTGNDLTCSKADLMNCRKEIEKLNHHICELSTMTMSGNNDRYNKQRTEDILTELLQKLKCHRFGDLPLLGEGVENELLTFIVSACQNKSDANHNSQNWQHNAISDLKRLYEAIDRALEILNAKQPVVDQYPELLRLQQDLEETNFTLATTLPSYTAMLSIQRRDLNANPTTNDVGGTEEREKSPKVTSPNGNTPNSQATIDSMA